MKIGILTFDARLGMYLDTLLFFKRYFGVRNPVSVLGCSGALERCTSMTSLGIRVDQSFSSSLRYETCKKCKKNQSTLSNSIDFILEEELDRPNIEQEEILSAVRNMEAINSSLLLDIHYENIPIGRLAFYDFAMHNKIDDRVILQKNQLIDFSSYLSDCFKVLNFASRVLSLKKFDSIVYVNGNYSLNSVARAIFLLKHIRCWSVEYTLFNTATKKRVYLEENRLIHSRSWPSFDKVSANYLCSIKDTQVALTGFRSRFKGVDHNSYSSPTRSESWVDFDEFKAKYRYLASIFVSSSDELRVHEVVYGFQQDKTFFESQIDWLNFLIDKSDPSVGYVIRLHPRLKPNKRDAVEAMEYAQISQAINRARQLNNFYIIDSDNPISSYYILLNSSISIVSWSMMGLESAVLGIPVVACFPKNMAFPIEKMSPQPKNLAEVVAYIQCRNLPKRTFDNDVETLKWIGINYYAIGIEILGVRYRRRVLAFIRSLIDRIILKSPSIFRIFFYKKYEKLIKVASSGGEVEINIELGAVDQKTECVEKLNSFRFEIYKYFKVPFTKY